MTLHAIRGFRLVTTDPDRLMRFYATIGFAVGDTVRTGHGMRVRMQLGDTPVTLERFDRPGRPYPMAADAASSCFQHLAIVTDDAATAWALADKAGATPISRHDPVTLPASSGGVTAIKCRDPEGHPLEFLQFPNMAAAGWPGRGILGIDHSAITVADGTRARAFYRRHGLAEGKATHNHGPAQAALDGLDDPDALVVPLEPPISRPHLELLAYRHPPIAGEPPALADIAATRIVWDADEAGLWQDPDGHWHETIAAPLSDTPS
ncbi:VOC family protein [uncultured Sphingomonas sp.]|uniref:VOC family protein n=1 Tax=uncultured Sphingomonas sp. TaxID=158754 RepID=UPI002618910D|nr:VOC family protein [uncultured Sphingomonas sp.]